MLTIDSSIKPIITFQLEGLRILLQAHLALAQAADLGMCGGKGTDRDMVGAPSSTSTDDTNYSRCREDWLAALGAGVLAVHESQLLRLVKPAYSSTYMGASGRSGKNNSIKGADEGAPDSAKESICTPPMVSQLSRIVSVSALDLEGLSREENLSSIGHSSYPAERPVYKANGTSQVPAIGRSSGSSSDSLISDSVQLALNLGSLAPPPRQQSMYFTHGRC